MIDYNGFTRLILKLFGIGLIVYGAVTLSSYLPVIFQTPWGEMGTSSVSLYVVSLAMPFLFGIFLWLFPATIANTIIRLNPSAKNPKPDLAYELERIGVSLLGLYLFYRAVSDIVYQVMSYRAKVALLGSTRTPDEFPALFVATIIELVVALILMLKAKGIVNLLRKARGH